MEGCLLRTWDCSGRVGFETSTASKGWFYWNLLSVGWISELLEENVSRVCREDCGGIGMEYGLHFLNIFQ